MLQLREIEEEVRKRKRGEEEEREERKRGGEKKEREGGREKKREKKERGRREKRRRTEKFNHISFLKTFSSFSSLLFSPSLSLPSLVGVSSTTFI